MLLLSVLTALATWCVGGRCLEEESGTQEAYESTGISPCDALLAAGFGAKVIFPAETAYEASVAQYYATSSRLRPWCIFQPLNTNDVSKAISTLAKEDPNGESGGIAVRSGGHSAAAFASGIVNGVTLDLGMMNSTSYNPSTGLASIQSGARWGSVYTALMPHNVSVSGGRDAHVGVGGLLLGGGISHYAARVGLSCDDIINYEIVLANGTILNANQTFHPDLWKALKGGTNNFGIVTRFDKSTIAGQEIWFSKRTISSEYSDDYVNALAAFTSANNAHAGDAVVGFLTHEPTSPGISIVLEEINTYAVPNGTSFAELNKIPANESTNTITPLAEGATQYPGVQGGVGSTLTFKNDVRILRAAVAFHSEAVSYLSTQLGPENFTTTCFLEPIPASVQRIGSEKGGNMLGLPIGQDVIVWDAGFSVGSSGADLAIAHAAMRRLSAQIKKYAQSVGGDVELVYANYADAAQDVIGSYPDENKQLMKAVSDAYDPTRFFQERVSGGFKLPTSG